MICRYHAVLGALLLLLGLGAARAQEPPPEVFEQALTKLDERIAVLRTEFPAIKVNDILAGTPRPAVVKLFQADPRKAMETIQFCHRKLDNAVFPHVKRSIYTVGATIDQSPTSRFNAGRRREILLEFVEIIKRKGLVLTTYYPGGAAKFTAPIQGDGEETWKAIDERYKVLAQRLKSEVEQERASSGGESGGGGGSSGGNWGVDSDEAAPADPDATSRAPDDDLVRATRSRGLGSSGAGWSTIVITGVVLIIFGLSAAILLPRVVAYGRSVLRQGLSRPGAALPDDPLKLGLQQFQRAKYDKALEYFERLSAEPGDRAMTGAYYQALCLAKMGRKPRAAQIVTTLPLNTLTTEEVYRLGRACEEAGIGDSAQALYREVSARDPSYKDVKQRLTTKEPG